MSRNYHKSAAVPFVNQKGERSMKRVKVPRYFAGKRPAYANEEDEEEEYITDDEEDYDEQQDGEEEEYEEEEDYQVASPSRKLDHLGRDSDDDDDNEDGDNNDKPTKTEAKTLQDGPSYSISDKSDNQRQPDESEDDEDDDPRFRRLKQIEAKLNPNDLANVQRTQQIHSRYESSSRNVVLDEDDNEEEVRQRHAIARRRKLEEPLGPQAIFSSAVETAVGGQRQQSSGVKALDDDERDDLDDESDDDEAKLARKIKRHDTDDILKDLKLTGITRPSRERHKTEAEQEAEQKRLKEALELAKQEAVLTSQTYKKVEEDIKKELEREALAKGDIGAREMSSAVTDDEDDELAYEEWKFREIKRVQRDHSERLLLLRAGRD